MKLHDFQQRFINDLVVAQTGRMAVYNHAMRVVLLKELENTYPIVLRLVGKNFFHGLAMRYIKENLSNSKLLYDYGQAFAEFIQKDRFANKLVYLHDMARLEWLISKIYIGTNKKKLDIANLAKIKPEFYNEIIFQIVENSYLYESIYPCDTIWINNQKDEPELINLNNKINNQTVKLFVWRNDYNLHLDRLTFNEYIVMYNLKKLQKFGKVCQALARHPAQPNILEIFPVFMQRGYIEGFIL